MSLFDRGAGTNTGSFSGSFINTGRQVLGGAGRLAGALSNLSNPSMALSQLRSRNLPVGGNTSFASSSAGAQWSGSESSNDWRVRLSLPTDPTFSGSPVLQPLVAYAAIDPTLRGADPRVCLIVGREQSCESLVKFGL